MNIMSMHCRKYDRGKQDGRRNGQNRLLKLYHIHSLYKKRSYQTGRYRLPYKMRVIVCAVRKPRNDNGGSYDNTE